MKTPSARPLDGGGSARPRWPPDARIGRSSSRGRILPSAATRKPEETAAAAAPSVVMRSRSTRLLAGQLSSMSCEDPVQRVRALLHVLAPCRSRSSRTRPPPASGQRRRTRLPVSQRIGDQPPRRRPGSGSRSSPARRSCSARAGTRPDRPPARTAPPPPMNRSRKSLISGGCGRADHRELAGEQGALLVDRREREPVVVHARLGALREEGVDEAGLAMQPAARRVVEHRQRRVAERDRRRLSAPPST